MDIFIDIQGFLDENDKFVPKEVAVLASKNEFIGHWIVKPTFPFQGLSDEIKKRNNWLTIHHHGIEWFEGETSINALNHFLQTIVTPCVNIYTRGRDKRKYLQMITSREIIDLEQDPLCPSYANMENTESTMCHAHVTKHFRSFKKFSCALNNVYKLRSWIGNKNDSAASKSYDTVDNLL